MQAPSSATNAWLDLMLTPVHPLPCLPKSTISSPLCLSERQDSHPHPPVAFNTFVTEDNSLQGPTFLTEAVFVNGPRVRNCPMELKLPVKEEGSFQPQRVPSFVALSMFDTPLPEMEPAKGEEEEEQPDFMVLGSPYKTEASLKPLPQSQRELSTPENFPGNERTTPTKASHSILPPSRSLKRKLSSLTDRLAVAQAMILPVKKAKKVRRPGARKQPARANKLKKPAKTVTKVSHQAAVRASDHKKQRVRAASSKRSSGVGTGKAPRKNFTKEQTLFLKAWLHANFHMPYPTPDQKTVMIETTGLRLSQINHWFINARQRLVKNGNRASLLPH